jgi:hypothetical protein
MSKTVTVKVGKITPTDYRKAIASVAKHGKCEYDLINPDGQRCAIGHMIGAKFGAKTLKKAQDGLVRVKNKDGDTSIETAIAKAMGFETGGDVTGFNDRGVYVDGLPMHVSEDDLQTFFAFGAAGAFK